MQKGQVRGRCVGGGGDKCRKVMCMGGVLEVVGISAERSSVWEVVGRCAGGRGDKCRKVKCAGGAREVCGRLKFEPYFEVIYPL